MMAFCILFRLFCMFFLRVQQRTKDVAIRLCVFHYVLNTRSSHALSYIYIYCYALLFWFRIHGHGHCDAIFYDTLYYYYYNNR